MNEQAVQDIEVSDELLEEDYFDTQVTDFLSYAHIVRTNAGIDLWDAMTSAEVIKMVEDFTLTGDADNIKLFQMLCSAAFGFSLYNNEAYLVGVSVVSVGRRRFTQEYKEPCKVVLCDETDGILNIRKPRGRGLISFTQNDENKKITVNYKDVDIGIQLPTGQYRPLNLSNILSQGGQVFAVDASGSPLNKAEEDLRKILELFKAKLQEHFYPGAEADREKLRIEKLEQQMINELDEYKQEAESRSNLEAAVLGVLAARIGTITAHLPSSIKVQNRFMAAFEDYMPAGYEPQKARSRNSQWYISFDASLIKADETLIKYLTSNGFIVKSESGTPALTKTSQIASLLGMGFMFGRNVPEETLAEICTKLSPADAELAKESFEAELIRMKSYKRRSKLVPKEEAPAEEAPVTETPEEVPSEITASEVENPFELEYPETSIVTASDYDEYPVH